MLNYAGLVVRRRFQQVVLVVFVEKESVLIVLPTNLNIKTVFVLLVGQQTQKTPKNY